MATADEYAAWIVKNKDKRGSPEFDTVAKAYQLAKGDPAAAPPVAEKTEAELTGAGSAALIGAGRTTSRVLDGLNQGRYLLAKTVMPDGYGGDYAAQRLDEMKAKNTSDDVEYKKLQEARPLSTMAGEVAPLLAAPMLGTGVVGAAASASLPGLVEYGTAEEKLWRGGMGAAGGLAGGTIGKMFARAPQPFKLPKSETLAASRAAADRLGVQLRPDEIVQSRPLAWFTDTLRDLPFSGGMAQKQETARRVAINSAGARAIGQTGDEITESVFSTARTDLNGAFNNLLKGRQIELGNSFRQEVRAVTGSKVIKELRDDSVDAIIAPFKNMPEGKIKVSGEWFQENKTALDLVIRGAYNSGETGKARALENFEKALERAAMRSMSGEEQAAYGLAQKQWANLRILETGKVVEGGNIMPGRLDSALATRYKAAYKEGKLTGELPDIGRLAQSYKPPPQSGTTPRAIYSGMAGGAMFANPLLTAAMFAAPPTAQKFLQSKAGQKYLTKGLLDVSPEMEKWLIRSGGGLLGLPATVGAGQ